MLADVVPGMEVSHGNLVESLWLAMIKGARTLDDSMQVTPRDSIAARLAEARALYESDRVEQAEALLRGLAAAAPAREDVATMLAEVLRNQGRLGAAAETMARLAEARHFEDGVAMRAAAFARECDRHAVAVRICGAALARGAGSAELLVLAGHVARESGEFAAARRHYLAALDAGIDLDRRRVLGALVNTRRYTDPGDPDRLRCEQCFQDQTGLPQTRASAGFALAKVLNDLGDFAGAAGVLREANGLVRALRPWAADTWRRFVGARQRERVTAAPAPPDSGFAPVFIVGVPRSGTTLTATRIARTTAARDRGELRALRFIAERLRSGGHLGSAAVIAEAAVFYRTMARQDDPPARVYLDQDPLNFRWLDIAAAMFPQAKVVHLQRDPRDAALSLWSQEFAHQDMAFSNDFDDITAFMQGHAELMAHWKATLGIPIMDLDYEALVADPAGKVAELAAFIGASDVRTEIVRSNADAPVTSASVWQARQPVYSTSVGRWRNYAQYVPELAQFGNP